MPVDENVKRTPSLSLCLTNKDRRPDENQSHDFRRGENWTCAGTARTSKKANKYYYYYYIKNILQWSNYPQVFPGFRSVNLHRSLLVVVKLKKSW